MKHAFGVFAALAIAVAMAAVPAWAGPAEDACAARKEKAAGRFGQGLFVCHAVAARLGTTADPLCLSRAASKFAAAFDGAEARGSCATTGDSALVAASVAADADEAVALLAHDAEPESRRCAGLKRKAAGRHYAALLACFGRGAARGGAADPLCVAKASSKMLAVFTKVENAGGCSTTNDAATVADLGSAGVRAIVADVSPVCGDGIVGVGNACDGGQDAACPGLCDDFCACTSLDNCGDGVAVLPEECDDGGQQGGDGCSALCQLENATALCAGVATSAGTAIDAVTVASGFAAPVHAAAPPLDATRLFVVERQGRIRIVRLADGAVLATPFLDIHDLVGTGGEGGLLSMAFDPDYETNRRFFVNYTNNAGHTVIARYEASAVDRNLAEAATARIVLQVPQPYSNHNGGQIAFGPDGYLYVGMGDGGGGGDPDENAQDDAELLGKMLRLDVDVEVAPYRAVPPDNPGFVDGSSDAELVWAKGLRNPWRFSFDRGSGDLVIADVGQGAREEIDLQPAASGGGENYGWDIFEGSACFEPDPAPVCPAPPTGFTMPVFEYPHDAGPCWSVTGGFVYRGCSRPALQGTYFYSDACLGFLRTFGVADGMAVDLADRTADATEIVGSLGTVVSFAEDARGELYVIDLGGSLRRLVAD